MDSPSNLTSSRHLRGLSALCDFFEPQHGRKRLGDQQSEFRLATASNAGPREEPLGSPVRTRDDRRLHGYGPELKTAFVTLSTERLVTVDWPAAGLKLN
jgi:hypothetical protein